MPASVRAQAVEQARALVDSLGHHPSIAVVVGPRRPDAQLDPPPTRRRIRADGERPRPAAIDRRPTAADVEQVGARPLGQAVVRTSRPDPDHRGPLRRRPAPPPARRDRQPPVVRLAARRSDRPRRLRPPDPEHGAIRQRVRRRFGALDASVLRRRARRRRRGPTSTGNGWPRPTATTSTRSSGSSHRARSARSPSGGTRRSTTNRTC